MHGCMGPWKGLAFRELSGACLWDVQARVSSQEEEPAADGKSVTHGGLGHLCSCVSLALRPLGPSDAVWGFQKLRQLWPAWPGRWIPGYEKPRLNNLAQSIPFSCLADEL